MARPARLGRLGPGRGQLAYGDAVRLQWAVFVAYQSQIVIMAGTVGQLEERFDVVSLVSRRHACLVSVSHYGPQGLTFLPRNVGWWRRVRDRVVETQGGLVEAVEVEGNLEA